MNKTDTRKVVSRLAAALVAAAAFAPAFAQERLSLAERVARLEQQAQQQQGSVSLVNQVQALQAQVQQLQGQVEELNHQLQELQQRNKDQYIDLDSRIGRLEGRAPAAGQGTAGADGAKPPAAAGTNPPAAAPAAAASTAA
ncbi:YbgF trimerization domain-containing protein, partial [Mizugakiibacter sediminis]|uniref:YbgF trimerization domain-containing protein n=1 Tax=Mizugakiibacter sediminis TaxID=1475481 RepID=UPI000AF1D0CA